MTTTKTETPLPENYHFPPELFNEVLLKLPPKTLLQLRCVCKSWCSLIDSPYFISMHLNFNPNNCGKTQLLVQEKITETIFTIRRSDNTFKKTTQLVEYPKFRRVYNSCMVNGLMLMEYSRYRLTLWNPSIRKSVMLPRCPLIRNNRCFLGFSPLANDYKVLSITYRDTSAVYSLRDHAWKVKDYKFNAPSWFFDHECLINRTVFAQGVVYWRPYHNLPNENNPFICFDFDVEEFSFYQLPDLEDDMLWYIFVLGGSLAVLGVSKMRSCIWVMENNGGTNKLWRHYWKRDTNSDVYEFLSYLESSDMHFEILYIEHAGKLLIQSLKKLMVYNIGSNQTYCLGKSVCLRYLETYVESLVLHKGYDGVALPSHGLEDDTKLGDSKG